MGGIMSLTGEPDSEPVKVGVGIADIMCGMYAVSAILAALHYRGMTGLGQRIDLGLLDTQVSWLTYEGLNYLTSGQVPQRQVSEHPNKIGRSSGRGRVGQYVYISGVPVSLKKNKNK